MTSKAFGNVAKLRWIFDVSDPSYGARGDGVTDDTVSLQAILDAAGAAGTGAIVRFVPGKTYLVSCQGTQTFLAAGQRYCLRIPPGVDVDLNNATVKLADTQNAAIFINKNAGTTQDTDIKLRNGTLDGNESNQTASATGEQPNFYFYDCLRLTVRDLRSNNARDYMGRMIKCDDSDFLNLRGKRSDGDGWSFGISGVNRITNSRVDNIYAEDCDASYAGWAGTGHQGNGVIFTAAYCTIGKVEANNVAGGNKIQEDSTDVAWDSSIFRGGANTTSNSGTKIQGTTGQYNCVRISISKIVSEGAHSEGLIISEATDCSIGSYSGFNNATVAAGTDRDVNFGTSRRCSIESIHSVNSGNTAGSPVVLINTNCEDYRVGSIQVQNAVGRAVAVQSSFYGTIDTVEVNDANGNTTDSFVVTSSSAKGRCGNIKTSQVPVALSAPQVWINTNAMGYEIGKVVTGSTDQLEGVVTLSNGATTTAVACGHIYKEYVGTFTTDHYYHPIIEIVPWNSSAMALEASGGFRTTVNRLVTTGTGFNILHAAAGASDRVYWKVIGWKVAEREQA